jgi:TRAP-type C4-dicarboxylate transport system substrate-binding protein
VPASAILQQFYTLAGANPTPVAWGETPSAIQQGVADALDPAVVALYAHGFKDMLWGWITFNKSVPDSQLYSCNNEWFKSLPTEVQEGIDFACGVTFQQNLAQVPASRAFAMAEMAKAGVQFYNPTEGRDRPMAGGVRLAARRVGAGQDPLAGSVANFDRLQEAARAVLRPPVLRPRHVKGI